MRFQQSSLRLIEKILVLSAFLLASSVSFSQTTPTETTDAAASSSAPKKKKAKSKAEAPAAEVVTPAPAPVAEKPPQNPIIEKVPTAYNGAPVMQFNTLGTPSNTDTRPALVFKTPTSEAEAKDKTMANPVLNMKNDTPFVTYVGYPKYEVGFTYAPNTTGFKQEYNSLPLNFSSSALTSYDLVGKILITPETSMELEYSYYSVGIKAKDLGIYQIKDSTAAVDSALVRGNYCFIYSNFYHRLCPGLVFGMDGYPSLSFADTTNIAITRIRDLVVGFNTNYQYPLLPKMNLLAKIEYLSGLKNGQNDTLGVTANNKTQFGMGVDFPWNDRSRVHTMFSYENRQATVSGKVDNITDTWKTNAVTLGLQVGFNYSWESMP